jgi:hypothetical protein
MKKVSIIFSHFVTFRWTAITVHFLKKYPWPCEWEMLVANNSPDHPSIQVLTETELGDGVTIIEGERDFPSHGRGNDLCLERATGSHVFFTESDAFANKDGWTDEYIRLSGDFQLIGPEIPQGSGKYIHPAGSLYDRQVFDAMKEWQHSIRDWLFCPDAAIELGTSDQPFHVVCHKDFFESKNPSDALRARVELWKRCGPMQEMRSFDSGDTFHNHMQRTGITNWQPVVGRDFYNKIGYEAGQVAAYFAESHGFKAHRAHTNIEWLPGYEGRQAAQSTVFGGFVHAWCGASSFSPAIDAPVRNFKMAQMNAWFSQLPETVRAKIEFLEERYA